VAVVGHREFLYAFALKMEFSGRRDQKSGCKDILNDQNRKLISHLFLYLVLCSTIFSRVRFDIAVSLREEIFGGCI